MQDDWDIEKYHNEFEPEEQWEMKKKFMESHKSLFSEPRVVCLAQVLVNVEFLGTRYPSETMKTIAELSQGIIEEFRERQKTRLQRTFVGAADAANAKVNRTGNAPMTQNTHSNCRPAGNTLNPSLNCGDAQLNAKTVEGVVEVSDNNECADVNIGDKKLSKKKKKKKQLSENTQEESVSGNPSPMHTDGMEPITAVETKNLKKKKKVLKKPDSEAGESQTTNVKNEISVLSERIKQLVSSAESASDPDSIKKEIAVLSGQILQLVGNLDSKNSSPTETDTIGTNENKVKKKKKRKNKLAESEQQGLVEVDVVVDETTANSKKKKRKRNSPDLVDELPTPIVDDVQEGETKKKKRKKANKKQVLEIDGDDNDQNSTSAKTFADYEFTSISSIDTHLIPTNLRVKSSREGCRVYNFNVPQFVLVMNEGCLKQDGRAQLPGSIFNDSAVSSKVKTDFHFNFIPQKDVWETTLLLDGVPIITHTCISKVEKKCKREAVDAAFEVLTLTQCKIVILDPSITNIRNLLKIETEDDKNPVPVTVKTLMESKDTEPLTIDDNIGHKMLKMMGWSGGGLGVRQQGITEPCKTETVLGRSGLGFSETIENFQGFGPAVKDFLKNYQISTSSYHLSFSNEFSNDQRRLIHEVARRIGLVSKSIGVGNNRRIIIRRSDPDFRPLVELACYLKQADKSDPLFQQLRLEMPSISDNRRI